MKKILLALPVFVFGSLFAQKNHRMNNLQDLVLEEPKSHLYLPNHQKLMQTIWEDDFSNPLNWTIDNNGQTGAQYGWNINNTSEGWWSANGISSTGTSGGNNAELVNGNPTSTPPTQELDVVYTLTTAAPINIVALGGSNLVSLQFKQFGARFNDLQEIQISTDGVNFITVGDNLDKEILSQAGGSAYPNPETKTINLATVLTANPTSVWIRFRWTTNIPSLSTNPNVWVTYGWYIDDVEIVTNPDYDLSITSNYWGTAGLNYYQIPTTQVAPIEFSTNVFNGGLIPLTGSKLKAEVFSGATNVFSGMSPETVVPLLDTASLDVLTQFTPPASTANYTLKRNIILGNLPNGQILAGSLSSGGLGYSTSNNVSLSGGTGTGATVNITATPTGTVVTGALSTPGTGYVTSTNVATTGATGTGLTLDITTEVIGAALLIDTLTTGSGYVDSVGAPTSAITGSGSGLTVGFTTLNGAVDSLYIVNAGNNYAINDTIQILVGDSTATFVIDSVSLGQILTATISNGGTGYLVNDLVTISGGTATFIVNTVTGGVITAVTVNNPGTGYSAGDLLTISGGSASFTVASVTNNTEITDEIPTNNTIADLNFAVTNYIYARDNGGSSGPWPGSTSNGTNGYEVGNLYDIWTDQTLNGLTVRLSGGANGTAVGTEIYIKLYEIDPATGDFVFLEESAPFIVATNNTNTLLTIPFLSPVDLVANKTYLAVVGSFAGTLRTSNAGSSDPQTSFFLDLTDNTWYYTTSTPVVRMNFDPTVSVDEVNNDVTSLSLFPNPSSSIINMEFEISKSSDVSYLVTDLSGKVVMERQLGLLNQGSSSFVIDASSYNSGLYLITLSCNGQKITRRIIKN
jgi:hypothetical protein